MIKRDEIPKKPESVNNSIAIIGLVLIILPMFLIDGKSFFPGWVAILPCLGAFMLIGWSENNIIGRLLSLKVFVWIGKISYSLYLWHWPLIVFWSARFGANFSVLEQAFLFSLSIILSLISTNYIEKPFRSSYFRSMNTKKVLFSSAGALLFIICLGVMSYYQKPSFREFPESVVSISEVANYRTTEDYNVQFRTDRCLIGQRASGFEAFKKEECTVIQKSKRNVLLIGDSHAAQYWGGLQEKFPDVNIMQATSSGCRPLIDANGAKRCTDLRTWAFDFIKNNPIDAIIIGGRWQLDEMKYVSNTLEYLKSISPNVILIGPTVEYKGELPALLSRSILSEQKFNFDKYLIKDRFMMDNAMRAEAMNAKVNYISVLDSECDKDECSLFAKDGMLMQFDYGHLTLSGARDVIDENYSELSDVINPVSGGVVH